MTRNAQEDGFTLVELLISLALLSLMAVYALSALSAMRDMNRVADRIAQQMEVEAVASHMRAALADARPTFITLPDNSPGLLFSGSSGAVEFVSAANGERETGGLYSVRYALNTENALVAERRLLRNPPLDASNTVVLLRGVRAVSFEYANSDTGQSATNTWARNDALPSLITINVAFDEKDTRVWPLTLVNLKTAR